MTKALFKAVDSFFSNNFRLSTGVTLESAFFILRRYNEKYSIRKLT